VSNGDHNDRRWERFEKIKRLRDEFAEAAKKFTSDSRSDADHEKQVSSVLDVYAAATSFFNELEGTITEFGLLGCESEDDFAKEITGLSHNCLAKIPKLLEQLRSHKGRLKLSDDSFQPGPSAFQNMQALVARFRPAEAEELKRAFLSKSLPTFGFDNPGSRMPKFVFPLHGIRTRAKWQRAFADLAQSFAWDCRLENWYFGWFSIFQFFSPWSREAKVRWFRATYESEMNSKELRLDEGNYPSIVAHSFGAFILGNALIKYEYIRFNKIILCGSILPRDFPWDQILERGQVRAVRNEYGLKDIWANRVGFFVPSTGSSGTHGFICKHPRLEQAEFQYDHSEYFEKGHMRAYWMPFLNKSVAVVKPNPVVLTNPRRTYPYLLYAMYALLVIVTLYFILRSLPVDLRNDTDRRPSANRVSDHTEILQALTSEDRAILSRSITKYITVLNAHIFPPNFADQAWTTAQVLVALKGETSTRPEAAIDYFNREAGPNSAGWRKFREPQYPPHIAASGWVLWALASFGQAASEDQLQFLLENQNDQDLEGWWPIYAGATTKSYASTYATAMAIVALHEQQKIELVEVKRATLQRAITRGIAWLLSTRMKGKARWTDYPQGPKPRSEREFFAISGIVIHALHHCAEPKVDLREIDRLWLTELPTNLPSAADFEASNMTIRTAADDPIQTDETRYYSLQWGIIATADAYANGTRDQRKNAIKFLRNALESPNTTEAVKGTKEDDWVAAELLFALRYLAHGAQMKR